MTALALTPADRALGRADVAAALTGHQPLTDRKPKPQRATKDHSATLARRLERLARAALPAELQQLRREPGEVWLLAHDPAIAARIDADRARKNKRRTARARGEKLLPEFSPRDARGVSKVLTNSATRERLRATAAGRARSIGTGDGEAEIAGVDLSSAPADLQLEAEQTLAALQTARLVDAAWHRVTARPATCGDSSDDAEALPVADAAERAGCSKRSVQVHMQGVVAAERDGGQLVLPCMPGARAVYKARPEVTP
ncbi:MAG: hypothetical protein ACLGSH_03630 [Acidobacteriota bacterium]